MVKTCFKCHAEKPIGEFYDHPQMADKHLNKCKDCAKRDMQIHRLTHPHVQERDRIRGRSEAHRLYQERHLARNKDRYHVSAMAAQKTRRAVQKGLLVKADVCEQCGADEFLEGAHHDYTKPLEVRWLCRRCHRREDARNPKSLLIHAIAS